jgi:renalase
MLLPLSNHIPKSVAIIGGGIAGLSCAKVLQQNGVAVRVFEKSQGVSGRMSTRRGEGWACDHGAQYFTARSEAFQREVGVWLAKGVAQTWVPRICVIDGEQSLPSSAQVSTTVRYVGAPAMTSPAQYLAKNLPIELNSCVDQLNRESLGWRLQLKDRGWQDDLFDAVVLALPAPQAMALLPAELNLFEECLADSRMRPTWTLMMRFDDDVDLGFDAAFVNNSPIRWIARQKSKPMRQGENIYVLHASADWSEAHLEEDAKVVERLLVDSFGALFNVFPRSTFSHRWRFADTELPLGRHFLWDSEVGLGLCGDWLKLSNVEGAWESGTRLAQRLLKRANKDCFDVEIINIVFGGSVYKASLALRDEILRKPLGRSLDAKDLAGENEQLHFGLLNENGELLACLSAKEIDITHYKLRQMAVLTKNQGVGLGAKLVAEVERKLLTLGVSKISLHARETAIDFYEKLGYQCAGNLFDEVGIAHIKMQKNIS